MNINQYFLAVIFIGYIKSNIIDFQEKDIPIFQPYPSIILSPQQECVEGYSGFVQPFELNNSSYVAISLSFCGIYIYDITNLEQTQLVFFEKLNKSGKVQALSISNNKHYLWIGTYSGVFYGIGINQLPFKIVIEQNSNQKQSIFKVQSLQMNEDIFLLLCEGGIEILDWRNKSVGFKYMKSIPIVGVKITQIEFIQLNQFALVTVPDKGVQFYQIQNIDGFVDINFIYLCQIMPNENYYINNFNIINEETISIMMSYGGLYMYRFKNVLNNNQNNCIEANFKLLYKQDIIVGLGGYSYLSSNKKFIYTSFRVQGIQILDISMQSYQIVQNIYSYDNSNFLTLNDKENLLFFISSNALQIYKRTEPNFNRNIPNLLLNTYQLKSYSWVKESKNGHNDYQCIFQENKKQLYITRSNYGVALLKYSGDGILEPISYIFKNNQLNYSKILEFFKDSSIAYLAKSEDGVSIIDFSNPSSPVIKKENVLMNQPLINVTFLKFKKNQKIGFVAIKIGVLIINIEDSLNPTIISVINTMEYTLGESTLNYLELSEDENIAFFAVFTYGILIYDISDPKKPFFKSKLFTDGASEIKLIKNYQYVLIAANVQGLLIARITQNYELDVISQTKIQGICYRLLIMNNEQHVIIAAYENPSISLVSISNLKRPEVLQKIANSQIGAYISMCPSSNNSEVFITTLLDLLLLQLKSKLLVHTQMYLTQSQKQSIELQRLILEKDTQLKVGQDIEIHLVPIYQFNDIIIKKAMYYRDFIIKELPSWMEFKQNGKILKLKISKDSLKKDEEGEFIETTEQIVFLIYQQILSTAFIKEYLNITQQDSQIIYKACIKEGYINQLGFIDDSYLASNVINLGINESSILSKWSGFNQTLVKDYIKFIINQNIINHTIQFKTVQSLDIDLSNKNEYIKSIQNQVIVNLSVSQTQLRQINIEELSCKFIKIYYSGVLVLYSEKQNEIQLEGDLKNINIILSHGIKLHVGQNQSNKNDIQILVRVSDSVNFDYVKILPLSQLGFISLQQPIEISNTIKTQQEINDKYIGGQLYIQESFFYQMSKDIFISRDNSKLFFSIKIEKDGVFYELSKNHWLQFSQSDQIFSGTPQPKNLYEKVKILVNATDGYTFITDTFEITPNLIPFSYAVQIIIQVLGIVIGILGFYRFKHQVYNIINKDSYTYSPYIVYVGEEFKKQIVVTEKVHILSKKLWKYFLQNYGEKALKNQLLTEVDRDDQMTSYFILNKQYLIQNIEKKELKISDVKEMKSEAKDDEDEINFSNEIMKKIYPFSQYSDEAFNNSKFNRTASNLGKSVMTESVKKDQFFLKQIQSIQYRQVEQENIQSSGKKQTNTSNKINDNRSIKYNHKHIKGILNGLKKYSTISYNQDNIEELPNQKQTTLNFFQKNGSINFNQILDYIIEKQQQLPNAKRIVTEDQIEQLKNLQSTLSQALYCYFIEFLVKEEDIVKNILEWLKQKALLYYKDIDWYKAYLDIEPQFLNLKKNPYPKLSINQGTFKSALKEIFLLLGKFHYFKDTKLPKPIKVQLNLLEEALKIKAIGFNINSGGYFKISEGESLHCFSHQINSIESYEKDNQITCCLNLHKKLDIEYKKKSLADNLKLPSWIYSVDLIHNVILLKGIPESKDIGNITIKVIDQNRLVLQQFEIKVLQNNKLLNQSNNQENILFDNLDMDKTIPYQIQREKRSHSRVSFQKDTQISTQGNLNKNLDSRKKSFSNQIINTDQSPRIIGGFEELLTDKHLITDQAMKQLSNFEYYSTARNVCHDNALNKKDFEQLKMLQLTQSINITNVDNILQNQ